MHCRYKAVEEDGLIAENIIDGENEALIRQELEGQGLKLISLLEIKEKRGISFTSSKKLSLFSKEWSALLSAGIPVTEALAFLAEGQGKKGKDLIFRLQKNIEKGSGIGDSFAETRSFPPFFCTLLKVGELSGTLPEQLEISAAYYKKEGEFFSRLKTALAYPGGILFFALSVCIVILSFVLPSFALLFNALEIPVPPVMEAALGAGLFFRERGVLLLSGTVLLFLLFFRWSRTAEGKKKKDEFFFRLNFTRRLFLIRFCLALSALLKSGMPLSFALQEMKKMETNESAASAIGEVLREVERGGEFSKALQKQGKTTAAFGHADRKSVV